MFDIGFAELLLIGVVGLLVVGPEQLPGQCGRSWPGSIVFGAALIKSEQRFVASCITMRSCRS